MVIVIGGAGGTELWPAPTLFSSWALNSRSGLSVVILLFLVLHHFDLAIHRELRSPAMTLCADAGVSLARPTTA
jgi:hypothetical protein